MGVRFIHSIMAVIRFVSRSSAGSLLFKNGENIDWRLQSFYLKQSLLRGLKEMETWETFGRRKASFIKTGRQLWRGKKKRLKNKAKPFASRKSFMLLSRVSAEQEAQKLIFGEDFKYRQVLDLQQFV